METIGLEGAITMASAASNTAVAASVSRAASAPSKRTPVMGMPWRRPTKYSWNSISPSPATVSMVWSGSSVTGRRPTVTPYAAAISPVTSVSEPPSARRWVR